MSLECIIHDDDTDIYILVFSGVIDGAMLVAGRAPGRSFSRGTAYCEQLDTHEPTATVREAFRFSAYLRQPPHVSKADKDKYVEEVIQLLELEGT